MTITKTKLDTTKTLTRDMKIAVESCYSHETSWDKMKAAKGYAHGLRAFQHIMHGNTTKALCRRGILQSNGQLTDHGAYLGRTLVRLRTLAALVYGNKELARALCQYVGNTSVYIESPTLALADLTDREINEVCAVALICTALGQVAAYVSRDIDGEIEKAEAEWFALRDEADVYRCTMFELIKKLDSETYDSRTEQMNDAKAVGDLARKWEYACKKVEEKFQNIRALNKVRS